MFTFRECRAEDLNDWTDMNLEFMAEEIQDEGLWNNAGKTTPEDFEKIFEEGQKLPEQIRFVIFEEDGKPVGFANLMLIFSVWSKGMAMILDDLYIRPLYRGKGYGREALEYIEKLAEEIGCKRLQFQSEETNPGAREFYKAVGYQPAEMSFYVKYIINH